LWDWAGAAAMDGAGRHGHGRCAEAGLLKKLTSSQRDLR